MVLVAIIPCGWSFTMERASKMWVEFHKEVC